MDAFYLYIFNKARCVGIRRFFKSPWLLAPAVIKRVNINLSKREERKSPRRGVTSLESTGRPPDLALDASPIGINTTRVWST